MTAEMMDARGGGRGRAILPWMVGGWALVVYMVTLNRWISLSNVAAVSSVSGWDWRPSVGEPVTFLLSCPFRLLPHAVVPVALNAFAAICAALVLALLARSVALLPQDLVPVDRLRPDRKPVILSTPTAWMPPVLASILCGLQLSFWEHATSASGEIVDLLIFAYVIRCLLEFRIDADGRWLWRCAFVYGAGMANDWGMVCFFPIFCVAVLRIAGMRLLLNRRLLTRIALWGSAGLCLYLLQPLIHAGSVGFWPELKQHLRQQKNAILVLQSPSVRVLAVAWLLPLVALSIRWRSHTVQFGDDTPLGVLLTKVTGHIVHGVFLLMCIWVAFDPSFSPRQLGRGAAMLSYYYLSALVFGYCCGYFLMFFRGEPGTRLVRIGTAAAGSLMLLLGVSLTIRNLSQVQISNGPAVRNFAEDLFEELPNGRCVALSEELTQTILVRAEVELHGGAKDPLVVETASLASPEYRRGLAARFGTRWPVGVFTNESRAISPPQEVLLVCALAAREPLLYLHPSAGLLVEPFEVEPKGIVQTLTPRATNDDAREGLPQAMADANERIWRQRWTNGLAQLADEAGPRTYSGAFGPLLRKLRLSPERNPTARALGTAYSKCLDYWGVCLQRQGRWEEAGTWFTRAVSLNQDNLAAQINLEFNERRRAGDTTRLDAAAIELKYRDLFAKLDNWRTVLGNGGPVDEPTFLIRTARVLLPGDNLHQATAAYARCVELSPHWTLPKLRLAECYLALGNPGAALQIIDGIPAGEMPGSGAGMGSLLVSRFSALSQLARTNEAWLFLRGYVDAHKEESEVLSAAADIYHGAGRYSDELAALDELLKRDPNHTVLLSRKGRVQLLLARYEDASATFSRVLSLSPSDDDARLRRAIACLEAGQLDAAQVDYEELLQTSNHSQNALFGLGAIAWRRHDTNAAILLYQQFLSNSPPQSAQYRLASDRLEELKTPIPR